MWGGAGSRGDVAQFGANGGIEVMAVSGHTVYIHTYSTVVWRRLVVVVCVGQCSGNAVITADLTCIGPY